MKDHDKTLLAKLATTKMTKPGTNVWHDTRMKERRALYLESKFKLILNER